MAKRPPQQQQFRVHFQVAPEQLGPTMLMLESLGIHDVHYEIVTDVHRWVQNQPAQQVPPALAPPPSPQPAHKQPKGAMQEAIIDALRKANGEPVTLAHLKAISGTQSSLNSVSGTLTNLIRAKRAVRVGVGLYAVGPKKGGAAKPAKPQKPKAGEISIPTLILNALKNGPLRSMQIIEYVQQYRTTAHRGTIRSAISAMFHHNQIKQLGDGRYALRARTHVPELEQSPPAASEPANQPATATEV